MKVGYRWHSMQQSLQSVSWIKSQYIKTTEVIYTTAKFMMLVLVKGILWRGDISHCTGWGQVVGLSEYCM
jgi:hypothetical protein